MSGQWSKHDFISIQKSVSSLWLGDCSNFRTLSKNLCCQAQIALLLTVRRSWCQCQIWQKRRCATTTSAGDRGATATPKDQITGGFETRLIMVYHGTSQVVVHLFQLGQIQVSYSTGKSTGNSARRCNDPTCKFAHGFGELRSVWTYPMWPVEAGVQARMALESKVALWLHYGFTIGWISGG